MAVVTILVGQCGNQLGADVLLAIADAAASASDPAFQHAVSTTFFRRPAGSGDQPPVARCVLVDMEPKAIAECRRRVASKGMFRLGTDERCVTKNEGSGNNWAFGFYGQGASRREAIEEQIVAECRHADALAAIHVVHSVAGGTGSGVGCLVSDIVRELMPHVPLMHSTVWPFAQGEVMTQWLNAALTLHVLDENADITLVLSNDEAQQAIARATAGGGTGTSRLHATKTVAAHAFAAINHALSLSVASFVMPRVALDVPTAQEPDDARQRRKQGKSSGASPRGGLAEAATVYRCPATIHDNISAVALNPQRKFVQSWLAPVPLHQSAGEARAPLGGTVTGWRTYAADALRSAGRAGAEAAMVVLRGPSASTDGLAAIGPALHQHDTPLNSVHAADVPLAPSLPGPTVACYGAADDFGGVVARCASRVETFLQVGAYLHHYERYGVDSAQVEDALLHCWSVADSYGYQPGAREWDGEEYGPAIGEDDDDDQYA